MTSTTTFTSALPVSIRERVEARLAEYRVHRAKQRVYRQTFNELASLSDRDLADLGIARSSIRAIAHEAAYGA
ncbi:DUF1127 domain-containing protein [Jannaschia sp. W003]|uniref:DUF1127 domain-containing protein n=1 Tax=Jannaschia sp. W003 TaxID=2867012 RepID=UPI0021A26FD9|nr:DUF1127 domain-containing protein [Jannaschia sp. W003]UWQ21110.1 DUF1127 domain-containing protein [Jannaschia sp. W003]